MDGEAVLTAAPATATSGKPLTHPDWQTIDKGPAAGGAFSADDCTPKL